MSLDYQPFVEEKPSDRAVVSGPYHDIPQESQKLLSWYQEYFLGKPHWNFLTSESSEGPLSVSVQKGDRSDKRYKIIIRTSKGSQRYFLKTQNIPLPWYRRLFGLAPSQLSMLECLSEEIPTDQLKFINSPDVPSALIAMEERLIVKSYKFGVLFVGPNDYTESQVLAHTKKSVSPPFYQFLDFLGETIELKNWKGYRGGLDNKNNCSGLHSVYTKWQNHEIMFHVCPFLPFDPLDAQRVERKRHIGNDIVIILFNHSGKPIQTSLIRSKQNHVVFVVEPICDEYKISVLIRKGVPSFPPALPNPPLLRRNSTCRDFLFQKLIQGERAAYKVPVYTNKLEKTRSYLLYDLAIRFGS